MIEVTKVCSGCKETKNIGDFYRSRNSTMSKCKPCYNLHQRELRKIRKSEDPVYLRYQSVVRRCYGKGITPVPKVTTMRKLWDGKCAISKEEISLDDAHLDRKDPTKGYSCGNIHWVSARINRIKNNATIEELETILKWLKSQ